MMSRSYLAAPGIGLVIGGEGATETMLSDRKANGDAFPGEFIVRIPRGIMKGCRDTVPAYFLKRILSRERFPEGGDFCVW